MRFKYSLYIRYTHKTVIFMKHTIKTHANTSATLEIDLKPYIQAYHQFKAAKITKARYSSIHAELVHSIKNVSGQLLWQDLFDHATSNMTQTTKERIKASPACFFMGQQFNESLKNAIDSVLSNHLETGKNKGPVDDVMRLRLSLNNNLLHDQVTVTLSDNGHGFKADFLETIATKTTRENTNYYQQHGSDKRGAEHDLLIGGAGRGLQELVALVDHGEKVMGPQKRDQYYEVPKVSALTFNNKPSPEHGAVISLTTSSAPLKLLEPRSSILVGSTRPETKTSEPPALTLPSRTKKLPPLKQTTEPKLSKPRQNLEEARKSDEVLNPTDNKTHTFRDRMVKTRKHLSKLNISDENTPPQNKQEDGEDETNEARQDNNSSL